MLRKVSNAIGCVGTAVLACFFTVEPSSAQFTEPVDLLWDWEGEFDNDNFGFVNRLMGDVDNDGTFDIGVGVPYFAGNGANSGKVYLYSGATGEFIRSHQGNAENEWFGYEIAGVGDVTGDGHSEYLICRPRSINFQQYFGPGEVVLYSGATGDSLEAWSTSDGFGLGTGAQCAGAGNIDTGGIGDVNGDGTPDFLFTSLIASTSNGLAGKVHVISGADWDDVLYSFEGEAPINLFGFGIGGTGDLNGDGCDDIIVGAPNAGSGSRGRAYIFSGCTGDPFPFSPLEPDTTGAFYGFLFAKGPGDVNADGVPDLSVTDLQDSEEGALAGKAYVYSGVDGSLLHKFIGDEPSDGFGAGRGCGDVDHDGHNDLLFSAFTDPQEATGAGSAFVFSGKDGSILREVRCNLEGDSFGFSTVGVGDLDDDGALEFMVSATNHDGAGVDRGRVYVIAGDIFPDPAEVSLPEVERGPILQVEVGPNPASNRAVVSFAPVPGAGPGEVSILDVTGSRVRSLASFDGEAARETRVWSLRDDSGRVLPRGVYFVRVAQGDVSEVRRLVLN